MNYRWRAPRKFAGVQYERGDLINEERILAVGREKLGSLLRTRLLEPDNVTNPLDRLEKSELIELADTVGADVDGRWGTQRIIEAIEAAQHDPEAGVDNPEVEPIGA